MKKFSLGLLISALLLLGGSPAYANFGACAFGDCGGGSSGGAGSFSTLTVTGGADFYGDVNFHGTSERLSGSNTDNYVDFNDQQIGTYNNYTTVGGGLYLPDSHIWFLKENEDIDAFIASEFVANGDIIYLASGTYTIVADIDVTKQVAIIGAGIGKTIISNATASINMFEIDANNVRIQDMTLTNTGTGAGTTNRSIFVDCTGTTVCSNTILRNLDITQTNGSGLRRTISWSDAGGRIENVNISVASTDDTVEAIRINPTSTMEAAATLYINNVNLTSVNSGGSSKIAYGINAVDTTATQALTIIVDGYRATASDAGANTSFGILTTGDSILMTARNGIANGGTNDFSQASSASLTLINSIAANTGPTGTITYTGTNYANNLSLAGTLVSTATGALGWNPVAGANTACNTTCTSACVAGLDAGASAFLACTDATADSCLCAGAN